MMLNNSVSNCLNQLQNIYKSFRLIDRLVFNFNYTLNTNIFFNENTIIQKVTSFYSNDILF